MKSQLLKILTEADDFVSGETLSQHLGISRVAIWKHIQKLQACEYRIQSGPKGYRLVRCPDIPYPWAFPKREAHIHYVESTPSTMDIARQLARKGCPEFSVVIAGTQTSGRGRMDRTWQSPHGGLYFTLVLRPSIPVALSPLINFVASLTLARTMQAFCGVDARVKWPNDILIQGRKVCGMLSEMEAEADQVAFVNIGIGININNDPPPDVPSATSIKAAAGKSISCTSFLSDFLDRLESWLRRQDIANIVPEWKACSATLGQHVRIESQQGMTEGKAVDVDPNGALVVKAADGSLKKIYYGDCFHNPIRPDIS